MQLIYFFSLCNSTTVHIHYYFIILLISGVTFSFSCRKSNMLACFYCQHVIQSVCKIIHKIFIWWLFFVCIRIIEISKFQIYLHETLSLWKIQILVHLQRY